MLPHHLERLLDVRVRVARAPDHSAPTFLPVGRRSSFGPDAGRAGRREAPSCPSCSSCPSSYRSKMKSGMSSFESVQKFHTAIVTREVERAAAVGVHEIEQLERELAHARDVKEVEELVGRNAHRAVIVNLVVHVEERAHLLVREADHPEGVVPVFPPSVVVAASRRKTRHARSRARPPASAERRTVSSLPRK